MTNNSRRLKHQKLDYQFFIKTNNTLTNLENCIISNVDAFVKLEQKYILKEHIKEQDLKRIEKHIALENYQDGYLVKLHIHIHHYSKFYFDIYPFLAKLNSQLELIPGSIIKDFKKPKNKTKPIPHQEVQFTEKTEIIENIKRSGAMS